MCYFVWVTVFLLNEICLYVKDGSPASTRSSSPKLDWMIKRGMVGVNFKTCPGFTLVSPFHTLCLLVLFIQFWFTLLWSGLGHFLALVVQLLKWSTKVCMTSCGVVRAWHCSVCTFDMLHCCHTRSLPHWMLCLATCDFSLLLFLRLTFVFVFMAS